MMSPRKKIFSFIVFPTLAVGFGIFFTSFLFNAGASLKDTWRTTNAVAVEAVTEIIEAPPEDKIGYFIKDLEKNPKLTTEAYLIGDLDTGEIIYDKNTDAAFPIASVSNERIGGKTGL